jgi:hypothetical protein
LFSFHFAFSGSLLHWRISDATAPFLDKDQPVLAGASCGVLSKRIGSGAYCREHDLSTTSLMQWARDLLSAEEFAQTCRTSAEFARENVEAAAEEAGAEAPREASA